MATVCEIMSDRYGTDWQDQAINHTFDIENSYRTEYRDLMVIRNAQSRNVHGYDEVLDVANYRTLTNYWEDYEAFGNGGPYSNVDVISLDLLLEGPEDLPSVLEALADYPVLDEQLYCEVEQETIEEHWDSYGRNDLLDAVAQNLGGDNRMDLTDAAVDMIVALVWTDALDVWPSMIDVSAVDFGEREVWEWLQGRIGRVVTLPSHYREAVTFDLRLDNLLEV